MAVIKNKTTVLEALEVESRRSRAQPRRIMERHSTSSDLQTTARKIAVHRRQAPLYLFLSKNRTEPAFGLVLALIFLRILIPQERYSKLYPEPSRRGIRQAALDAIVFISAQRARPNSAGWAYAQAPKQVF